MPARTRTPGPLATRHRILVLPLLTAALAAAACSSNSSTSATSPAHQATAPATTPSATPSATAASGTTIKTARTSLGTVLTDGKGVTV